LNHCEGVSDDSYKLDELARAAQISARTVRYYVQRGLLPAPAFRGKDTAYGREHLVRLRVIRRLQDAFFPLDAIAVELARRSLAELERLAEGAELPSQQAPAPRQTPEDSPSAFATRLLRRIDLAPGVELTVAEDAPAESRALVEELLGEIEAGRWRK
jgi:DNA-binding transcriptional MerR regulator